MTAAFDRDEEEYGGIIDDVRTAIQWVPILRMLQKLEVEKELVPRLKAIQDIAAFAIKTGVKEDPYKNRAFLIFCKLIETVEKDPQWQGILKDVLK